MPDRTSKALNLDRALEQFDSKFRFVLLASARAEQLVRGARPKLEGSKKSTRLA
ncbi:MAG TPA: DNA-directed RNA polymerase subunit omega, partial [Thermoanaerobaculia bacterium]|nr:DNA-directed RNA polymerase subunit omega [Thermoanaerobaculia bacterium]